MFYTVFLIKPRRQFLLFKCHINFFTKLKFKIILEEVFNVKVLSVNSMILPVKRRRLGKFEGVKNSYKRIYVTLLWIEYFLVLIYHFCQ